VVRRLELGSPTPPGCKFSRLNTDMADILMEIREDPELSRPPKNEETSP